MTGVPFSLPEKDVRLGELPVTVIEKSEADLVPPLSLTTCFFTKRWAGWSSLEMVQVFCSPAASVPTQPAESVGE